MQVSYKFYDLYYSWKNIKKKAINLKIKNHRFACEFLKNMNVSLSSLQNF